MGCLLSKRIDYLLYRNSVYNIVDKYCIVQNNMLYITHYPRRCIYKIDLRTNKKTVFISDLIYPQGITSNKTDLFVCDGNRVLSIKIKTKEVTVICGRSRSGYRDGFKPLFDSLSGITKYGSSLFVCDRGNNKVREINLVTNYTSTIIMFIDPVDVICYNQQLFVSDYKNNNIKLVNLNTKNISIFKNLSSPHSLFIHRGYLYIKCTNSRKICFYKIKI
jgi:hypothetical protein